jgi:hypothetical protein
MPAMPFAGMPYRGHGLDAPPPLRPATFAHKHRIYKLTTNAR